MPLSAYSGLFQPISAYFSRFQHIHVYSNLFQSIPVYSILFQSIPVYSSLFLPFPVYSRLFTNQQSTIHNLQSEMPNCDFYPQLWILSVSSLLHAILVTWLSIIYWLKMVYGDQFIIFKCWLRNAVHTYQAINLHGPTHPYIFGYERWKQRSTLCVKPWCLTQDFW